MKKENIFKRLKKEFQLVIRNSENLEEKNVFKFNYLKLIFIGFSFVIFSITISTLLIRKILGKWIDPTHLETENKQNLIKLNNIIDVLEKKINIQTAFIELLQKNITSNHVENIEEELIKFEELNNKTIKLKKLKENIKINDNISNSDLYNNANKEIEITHLKKINSLIGMSFFIPVSGIITSGLDHTVEHYGVDIVSKKNEPIKSIADGIVIFSDWTVEGGNVIIIQHKKNLLSIYKHNSQLLKKAGNFIRKGDAVAIIGNSGEYSTGPHLHFEMWYNGSPINPEEYIIFDFNKEKN